MTQYLTLDDAVLVLDRLGFTARDIGLLSSSLARPGTTLGERDAYPTLARKAAALLESVVRNHSLIDGNKRTGWVLTSLFFWINGSRLDANQDEAFELVMAVARNETDLDTVEAALSRMVRPEGFEPPTY